MVTLAELPGLPLSYPSMGATAGDFPEEVPEGFRPEEFRVSIGAGRQVFEESAAFVQEYGLQRAAGLRVTAHEDGRHLLLEAGIGRLRPWVFGTRVVERIETERERGFAYGTLPGHPESGEERFWVQWRGDDSVWLRIRCFSRPSTRFWWTVAPLLRLVQGAVTRRYLRALPRRTS